MSRTSSLLLLLASAGAPTMASACGVSAWNATRPAISLISAPQDETPGIAVTALGHASFLLETPAHVTIVTDYNGINIPADPPTIATMNHAHSTHFTMHPDPRIPYVLHGWKEGDEIPQFDLTVGDVRVRNLATNIRDWNGGTEYYGNSIFVFESAGLCIAHLSHLHHLLTPDDVATLGPLDVVMMPIDGVWTMSLEDVAQVMEELHAPMYIPFHYYGDAGQLNRFLGVVKGKYQVVMNDGPAAVLTRASLPASPEIFVLAMPPG